MSGFWQRILGKAPPPSAFPTTQPAGPATEPAPAPGLERYELQRELGRGAMAIVHLARERDTDRLVAIKRMAFQRDFAPEDLADVRQRFMREARAAGHLHHPDIPRMLDAGESAGDAWIAMEYVEGQDLSHFTHQGQLLPVADVLRLAVRLARALGYAHSQGVVHRDIKPANVMFDRAADRLMIMDFGIARIADGSRTRTGLVLGTPSFMSPEQLAGLKVDGRSDLYSLGVMLYQLLTGHLPHHSESMAKLMYMIANEVPADVRQHRPELPEGLALVLALALEKRPELRYASGEQMAQDLEAVLARLPSGGSATPSVDAAGRVEPATDDSVDPFAQTMRLKTAEPGQNPAPPSSPPAKT